MSLAKTTLGIVFAAVLVVANVTAAKLAFFDLPAVGGVAVPAGFVAIGVAFLCSDLICELYGKDYARDVVNSTIGALVVAMLLIQVSIILPTAPFYEHEAAFNLIMGESWIIVAASIITMCVSQNLDVSIFHRIKSVTGDRHKWARNIGSTSISQFVDTALFIGLGFVLFPMFVGGNPQPLEVAASMIVGQYLVKLAVAGLDTPLFYLFSGIAERVAFVRNLG